jgi:glutathione S-transferase
LLLNIDQTNLRISFTWSLAMTSYRLNCFPESGGCYKVALMLNLCGADWEPNYVDYFNGETRTARWRDQFNAMGELPVLEHDDEKLSQSGSILFYLVDQFTTFGGRSEKERRDILRWISFRQPQIHKLLRHPQISAGIHPNPSRSGGDDVPTRTYRIHVRDCRQASWPE